MVKDLYIASPLFLRWVLEERRFSCFNCPKYHWDVIFTSLEFSGAALNSSMPPIGELDKIPDGTLLYIDDTGTLQKVSIHALGTDKTIVIFGVPGAFTPTCSLKHIPGFLEKGPELKEKGVAHILCISVNDPFVMKEWANTYDTNKDFLNKDIINFLADGSAVYTKALGMEFDLTDKGMGMRSRRYALLVDNLKVKKANVEEGGNFEVSSADEILKALMSCF